MAAVTFLSGGGGGGVGRVWEPGVTLTCHLDVGSCLLHPNGRNDCCVALCCNCTINHTGIVTARDSNASVSS